MPARGFFSLAALQDHSPKEPYQRSLFLFFPSHITDVKRSSSSTPQSWTPQILKDNTTTSTHYPPFFLISPVSCVSPLTVSFYATNQPLTKKSDIINERTKLHIMWAAIQRAYWGTMTLLIFSHTTQAKMYIENQLPTNNLNLLSSSKIHKKTHPLKSL